MRKQSHFLTAFILISFLISFFIGGLLLNSKNKNEVHIHAGFKVVKDNKVVDFTDIKYMQVKPCDMEEASHSEHDDQIEKAHLHDLIGDVIHVHRKDAKWRDLFININYPIDNNASAYINGVKVEKFQDKEIEPYESLVILIGKNDVQKALKQAVKKDHIIKTEKRSENCGN